MPPRKKTPGDGYFTVRPGTARVQFLISVPLADELVAIARAEGKTVSWKSAELIRQALAEYDAGLRTLVPAQAGQARFQPDMAAQA